MPANSAAPIKSWTSRLTSALRPAPVPNHPTTASLFDDVFLERGRERQKVALFFFRHFEFIQDRYEVIHGDLPIVFVDPEAGMGRLGAAAGVKARPAGTLADLIHDQLAQPLFRIGAVTDEKARELLVGRGAGKKLIDHGGDGVVAAEPLV